MNLKKIIAHGDSWTVGEGWNQKNERILSTIPNWVDNDEGFPLNQNLYMI